MGPQMGKHVEDGKGKKKERKNPVLPTALPLVRVRQMKPGDLQLGTNQRKNTAMYSMLAGRSRAFVLRNTPMPQSRLFYL
jgi:hypothetical protein